MFWKKFGGFSYFFGKGIESPRQNCQGADGSSTANPLLMIFSRVYLVNLSTRGTKKRNKSYFTVLCYILIGKPAIQSPLPGYSHYE
jgi:hypothetical protein